MKVDKTIKIENETPYGIMKIDCKVELEDLGKDYKASISIGDKINNHYIFNKKDIDKLSSSTNSSLFKGMKGLDTNYILSVVQGLKDELNTKIEQQQYMINQEYEKAQNNIIRKGESFFNYCKENNILPSNYIMKASTWKVANEEVNVLKLILGILSTMCGEPVNLISKASAGSGKSIVEDTAFDMVYKHNYTILNYSTPAAFKNACIGNPYLFKNKIVRLGDLGSEIAEEVMEEVLSIIKILNSEGYYKSSKMVGQEDILEIELIGHCAMCFSKVPNDKPLDSQDVSRGILWTPNIHNDEAFSKFIDWVDFKSNEDKKYEKEIYGNIKNYLEYLTSLNLEIFNPYKNALNKIFEDNEAYRRLLIKQDSLLKMLALLNLPNKKIIDGKRIYVSATDFELYCKLFGKSLVAMSEFNVTESDMDFLQTLEYYYDKLDETCVHNTFIDVLDDNNSEFYIPDEFNYNELFLTINDVVENMSNERSVHNIIGNVETQKSKSTKIRNALNRLSSFIGKFYIPDENWKSRGFKPTLYYLKKDNSDKRIQYFINNYTLSIINEKYGEYDVKYVIDDMVKNANGFEKGKKRLTGCIEDINDKSVFDCSVVKEPEYMNVRDFDLDKFLE